MLVKLEAILPNPYRDMTKYPIDPIKVMALKESIEDTDFWDNIIARPVGNVYKDMTGKELASYLSGLTELPEGMEVELGYGHHRWYTLIEMEYGDINIPVKVIDDEVMLKIMANENKGDWSSNMAVILETVRQVRGTLHEQATEFEDFEDYMERYSFFKTAKNFNAAKKLSNIGYRRIHQFLGETWSENDIRFADATLKAIDEGLFEQGQVIFMPSIGIMNKFQTLAKAIRDQDWPDFFSDKYVQEASEILCDAGSTVKIVGKAAQVTKKGNLPIAYLKRQKIQPFDLVKELVKVVNDDEEMTPEGLLDVVGLGDYEGIGDTVAEVAEAIKKADERREAAGGATPDEADADAAVDAPTDLDEAQAAIEAAETEAGAIAEPEFPTTIDVPDEDADVRTRIEMIIQTAEGVKFQFDQLKGKVADLDDPTTEILYPAFDKLFKSVVQFGLEAVGKQYLIEEMEKAEEEM